MLHQSQVCRSCFRQDRTFLSFFSGPSHVRKPTSAPQPSNNRNPGDSMTAARKRGSKAATISSTFFFAPEWLPVPFTHQQQDPQHPLVLDLLHVQWKGQDGLLQQLQLSHLCPTKQEAGGKAKSLDDRMSQTIQFKLQLVLYYVSTRCIVLMLCILMAALYLPSLLANFCSWGETSCTAMRGRRMGFVSQSRFPFGNDFLIITNYILACYEFFTSPIIYKSSFH